MLKNNSKMAISKYSIICLFVVCLMFTAFGFAVENSFASELNATDDEMAVEYDIEDKLENSQNDEMMKASSQESDVLGVDRTPTGNTFKDIQTCINGANAGDTIKLKGTYTANSASSVINITKKLKITSDSGATLDGKKMSSIFHIKSGGAGTTLNNLKFVNANGKQGSAVLVVAKNVQVQNCVFENNYARAKGVLSTSYALYDAENLKIRNCNFTNNYGHQLDTGGDGAAGAVGVFSMNAEISNCIFDSNRVISDRNAYGGALQIGMDDPEYYGKVQNCIFKNNRAISSIGWSHGGAGCVRNGVEYLNCIFINNSADQGGALTMHASGNIYNCVFINNTANTMYGGAISTGFQDMQMIVGIINCTFEGNTAPTGGAIQAKGSNVEIARSKFNDNYASSFGGAVYIEAEDVTVRNSQFNNNTVDVDGGAIYVKGVNTIIEDSSFISNDAIPDVKKMEDGLGGAIYVNSTEATINGNRFMFNTARNGSAIYYDSNGKNLYMLDNVLYENQAWVYALPISAKDIYYGDAENVTVVIHGGNNIADYDNLAVSNAIYNAADYGKIEINTEHPVEGATDSGKLYQDDREYNIEILLTITHEEGDVVYNGTLNSNYLGEIGVVLDDLRPGKYYVSARHFEDTYYKPIANTTSFRVSPKVDNKITISTTSDVFNYEDVVVWTVNVTNDGPNDATGVVAYNVIPDGMIWFGDESKGRYDPNAGKLDIGNLNAGEKQTFLIKTIVNRTGDITSRANVTAKEYDVNLTNNYDDETIHVSPAADLEVTKTVSNSKPNNLEEVTWTITVVNHGPDVAHNVVVKDLLPDSLVWKSDYGPGQYDHSTGIWEIGTLDVNDNVKLNIVCQVTRSGMVQNNATVNGSEYDYDLSNNKDHENIFVNPVCDLSIEKSVDKSTVNYGDTVTWTLVITNNGPDAASNVMISDILPKGLEYVDSTSTKGKYSDGRLTVDSLGVNENITVKITSKATATGNYTNVANVTSDTFDNDLTNNEDNETLTVSPAADLEVVKEVSESESDLGDTVTWTITVTNHGPDVAHDVKVYDLLPDSLIWVSDDGSGDYDHSTGVWKILQLDIDESITLNIDCIVNRTGSIQNNASVEAREYDYNLSNNQDQEIILINPACDLSIVKSVDKSTINYGDTVTWTLVITNNGPDAASNVQISDILPEGLEYVDSTSTKGKYSDGIWTVDSLGVNENIRITITSKATATGNYTNVANVTSDTFDKDLTNNEDNETLTVSPAADLEVVKEVSESESNLGDTVTWTITVTNHGPDVAHDVKVYDVLPDSLIWVSDDGSGDYDHSAGVWKISQLNVDESCTLNIDCIVNRTGSIQNNASVEGREYDYDLSNNQDQEIILVNPASDLSIEKSVDKSTVNYGDIVTWTLVITNNGPDAASNVRISDIMPEGLEYVDSTSTRGKYSDGIWTVDSLGVNENITVTITSKATATGNITNVANVTSDTYDNDPSNNEDNETLTVSPAADLEVVKEVSESESNLGDTVTWTITVTNHGPDDAHDIRVYDLLPDSLIWVSDDGSGDYDHSTGVWKISQLDVDESCALKIDCIVNRTGSIQNNASVEAREYDYDLSNNQDQENILVNPASDLSIEKSVDKSTVNYGDTVTWTLVITNNGPDAASNVRISDILPEGLEYVSSTFTKGKYSDGTWTVDSLGVNENITVTITSKAVATGNITNVANVTSDTYDNDPSNNEDNETLTVSPAADLEVVKDVSESEPNLGDTVTWTITVTNHGPDAAHDVKVYDLLPDSLIWVSDDGSGDYDHSTGVWKISQLDVDESCTLNIDCIVNATGSIQNNVSVEAREYDYNMTNNFANETIDVGKSADVSVVKTVNNTAPNYGDTVKWTIVITNNGPDKANEICVDEILPDGLIFISYNATKGIYHDDCEWIMCCLEVGEVQTMEIICKVNRTGKITNAVRIHANEYDPDESNNDANCTIDVPKAVDIQVTVDADNTHPSYGDDVIWMLCIKNNGPDDATDVLLKDILPDGLIFNDYRLLKGSYSKDAWTFDSLKVGESQFINITTKVNALGKITDKANVTCNEYDWKMSNNRDDSSIDVSPIADLSVVKLVSQSPVNYGDTVKWTLIASNNGPNKATNVKITDKLPAGLTFVESNGDYDGSVWNVGDLDVNETKEIEIVCKASKTGRFVNVADISGDENDPDSSNNHAEEELIVNPAADLSVTKVSSRYHYMVGDVVEYVIEVENNGPDTAYNVSVDEIMDDMLNLKSFKASKGKFDESTLTWSIDSLQNGESARLYIRAIASGEGIVKNTVSVSSDTFDYDLTNNEDFSLINVTEKPVKAVNPAKPVKPIKSVKVPENKTVPHHAPEPEEPKVSVLQKHPTGNPLVQLLISLMVCMAGVGISKRR